MSNLVRSLFIVAIVLVLASVVKMSQKNTALKQEVAQQGQSK